MLVICDQASCALLPIQFGGQGLWAFLLSSKVTCAIMGFGRGQQWVVGARTLAAGRSNLLFQGARSP